MRVGDRGYRRGWQMSADETQFVAIDIADAGQHALVQQRLGDRSLWRKPEILADATVAIFAKPPDTLTGQALIDEDFLRAEGVTDFSRYRCDPEREPPRIGFDFKLQAG